MYVKQKRIAFAVLQAVAGMAVAVSTVASAQSTEPQKVEKVEVTGSSIKRLQSEAAAPIQVITREDIEKTGATSVEQLLRTVSATNSSNATVAASASGATTGGISTASLRGLTAERTLILINGKRVTAYGAPNSSVAVDVDSIPISAIERIEVLKDGASAIYGSDAIAGVINFILRRDFRGAEISVGYGSPEDGKGDVAKVSGAFGYGDIAKDRFNVMITGSYQKDGGLLGADRDFAATAVRLDKDNFGGSSRSNPGNIAIPGVGVRNPLVSNGVGNCGPFGVYVPDFSPTICLFDTGPYVTLIPKTERVSFGASGRFQLSPSFEAYASFDYTKKEARTTIQPSPIDAAFGIPFILKPTSSFYPTAFVTGLTGGATPDLSVRYRPFFTGPRDITDTGENNRFVAGVQGSVGNWDLDFNVLSTKSQVTEFLNSGYFRIDTDASGPGIVPLLSSGRVNPFGSNSADVEREAFATNFIGQAFKTKTSLDGVQAKGSTEWGKLAGGGIGVALGAELRREKFTLDSADALGTGNISGYGGNFADTSVKRNVGGIFAELSMPVTRALQVDAAVRYDNYGGSSNPNSVANGVTVMESFTSVDGDALPASLVNRVAGESVGDAPSFNKATGKVGLRWRANEQLLVRGTVSTGFRAPSLLDLFGPLQTGVSAVQNDPARCRGDNAGNPNDCATQFNVYSGGRNNLKPESSVSTTLGLVFQPNRDVSVGIDYYTIDVKDLVQTLSSSFLLQNEAAFAGRVSRGAPTGDGLPGSIIAIDQRLENLGKAKVSGFDIDFSARFNTGLGRMTTELNATYIQKWASENPDGTFSNAINSSSSAVTGVIPRFKYNATASLTRGAWTGTVGFNWQNSYADICGNLVQDDFGNCPEGFVGKVGAYETWDIQAKYAGVRNLSVVLGIKNLFDRDPPYVNGSGGAFQSGYDPTYVDPRGRYFYGTLTYKFR
jgi:iron complex outermembrane recepter protein